MVKIEFEEMLSDREIRIDHRAKEATKKESYLGAIGCEEKDLILFVESEPELTYGASEYLWCSYVIAATK